MKRREFISDLALNGDDKHLSPVTARPDKILSGLEEYTEPLDKKRVYHLLRRFTFASDPVLAGSFVGKTASEVLDLLLGDGSETPPDPPTASWVTTPFEDPLKAGNPALRFQIEGDIKNAYNQFIDWWIDLMRNDTQPFREKLVLFWSTLWTIEFTYDTLALNPPGLLLRNNQTLRRLRFGNYPEIVEAMTLDGSMLLYQSLFYSNRKIANENYMREMLELFTMGTGDITTGEKNYTEADIKEGAKALTGWRTGAYFDEPGRNGYYNTWFSPDDHIIDAKQFMNNTIAARSEEDNSEDLVKRDEVRGIINIIFKERKNAIGRFVSDKIYKYFVYSMPSYTTATIINPMAQYLIDNNFNLRSFFKKLFTSTEFFNESHIGVQLKTPPDFIIGLEKMLGVKYSNARNAIFDLEQVLYDPPNVGSWKGYHTWLSTKTFPLRVKYGREILALANDNALINLAKKFSGFDNPDNITSEFCQFFLANDQYITSERLARYKSILLNNQDESQWASLINSNSSLAAQGIRSLISAFLTAPDFQLC